MRTMPTVRRGRTVVQTGANDNRGCNAFCSVFFIILLLIIPPIAFLVSESMRHTRYVTLSDALNSNVIELNQNSVNENSLHSIPPGELVHGTSSHIDTLASDEEMNVSIPGALVLKRNTEYCQWQEIQSQNCQTCRRTVKARDGSSREESYQCNCVTTYHYVKGWRGYQIDSLLFDQPGKHYNPQRDPMPSAKFVAQDAVLEFDKDITGDDGNGEPTTSSSPPVSAQLDPTMLDSGVRHQPWRNVNFVPRGKAPQPSIFSRISSFIGLPSSLWKTRYEPLQMLKDTPDSIAARQDNFVYVGQGGGYFFSPYVATTAAKLFNYFAQYMEGTLFDYQLGDLVGLASCTAGDIRFYYSVQDPNEISVLGQVRDVGDVVQITPRVLLGVGEEKTSSIGLVHSGSHSAKDMLLAENSDSLTKAVAVRAILFLWCIAASRLAGVAVGREIGDSSFWIQMEATVGLFFTALGLVWLSIWGSSFHSFALVIVGCYSAYSSYNSSVKKGDSRWYIAVWSKIGQWANLAPELRQEDTYIPSPIPHNERTKVS